MGFEPTTLSLGNASRPGWLSQICKGKRNAAAGNRSSPLGTDGHWRATGAHSMRIADPLLGPQSLRSSQ